MLYAYTYTSHDKNILESATLLSLPQRQQETHGSKHADFTQRNERHDHFAAVTFSPMAWTPMAWTPMAWTPMAWTHMALTHLAWTPIAWTPVTWTPMAWTP